MGKSSRAKSEAADGEEIQRRPLWAVLPFIVFLGVFLAFTVLGRVGILPDRCNVKEKKRKDCGWSGMATSECLGIARFYLADGPQVFAQYFFGFAAVAFVLWKVSGYGPESLGLYGLMAGLMAYNMSACCYNDQVTKPGTPHCYVGGTGY